jgi:6,7-dimethyl-8-ribityllumazine synthase
VLDVVCNLADRALSSLAVDLHKKKPIISMIITSQSKKKAKKEKKTIVRTNPEAKLTMTTPSTSRSL